MNYGNAQRGEKFSLAAGAMTPVLYLARCGAGVTVVPGAAATMRVFFSTSLQADIDADLADGSLSYANLLAGTPPNKSTWMLWASGAVTVVSFEGPEQNRGSVALLAMATGGPGAVEVTR